MFTELKRSTILQQSWQTIEAVNNEALSKDDQNRQQNKHENEFLRVQQLHVSYKQKQQQQVPFL
jgi:hypothetical protein